MNLSRDFILILGGGMVSLMTTLVVLFVSDYIYRRDELLYRRSLPVPPMYLSPVPNDQTQATTNPVEETAEAPDESTEPVTSRETVSAKFET